MNQEQFNDIVSQMVNKLGDGGGPKSISEFIDFHENELARLLLTFGDIKTSDLGKPNVGLDVKSHYINEQTAFKGGGKKKK